jgi:hypothetical protein
LISRCGYRQVEPEPESSEAEPEPDPVGGIGKSSTLLGGTCIVETRLNALRMVPAQSQPIDWTRLTDLEAGILEAYFSLFQEREPSTIGSGEILRWFRAKGRIQPSEAAVRTVLAAVHAPRRRGGRPSNDSHAPPFLSRTTMQSPKTGRSLK